MKTLPPVIEDRLGRLTTNPTSATAWHRLVIAWQTDPGPDIRKQVIERLLSDVPDEPIPDFLRATCAYSLTREPRFLEQAGLAIRRIAPIDLDRLQAFLVYAFASLLAQSDDRDRYLGLLRKAAFPEISALVCRQLMDASTFALEAGTVNEIRRVAIITPELANIDHAPTTLALQHARLLAEQGLSVHVFCAQDLRVPDMPFYLGGGEQSLIAPPNQNAWSNILPNSVPVYASNSEFSLNTRWNDVLGRIGSFDPDLVFLIGFTSPLVALLYQVRPVLGLSVNTLPPVAPVDLWLCADERKAGTRDDTWSPWFPPAEAWHYPYRIMLRPPSQQISREQLGVRAESVVLISVGDRLDREIRPAWASRMKEFLAKHPRVEWIILGGNGQIPPALAGGNISNIRPIAHHPEVRSFCRCSDIFVNPPRMGGGFSVAGAMADGLPVLAYAGSDGGDKLGSMAVADDDEYFARLAEWVASSAARQQAGKALQQRFDKLLNLNQAGTPLIEACRQAVVRFNKRISQAPS